MADILPKDSMCLTPYRIISRIISLHVCVFYCRNGHIAWFNVCPSFCMNDFCWWILLQNISYFVLIIWDWFILYIVLVSCSYHLRLTPVILNSINLIKLINFVIKNVECLEVVYILYSSLKLKWNIPRQWTTESAA